jgi:Tfp pilus assembly protein PilX
VIYIIGIDKISKFRFFCRKKLNQNMKPGLVQTERGFVLPLSVAVGAILMLLGVMMIMRASQGDKTAIAAKSTSRSQAVAEAGLTHFQSFLNQNRILATACSNNTAGSNCAGPPADPLTWNNFCAPTSTSSGAYTNILNDWNDLNGVTANGQYRLVKYAFNPDSAPTDPPLLGEGELILEGRVNQEGNEAFRISTTRLEAKFQTERTIDDIDDFPALWFNRSSNSSTSTDVTFATLPGFLIWDTSCPDQSNASNVQQFKALLNSNVSDYREIPGLSFPDLPSEGQSKPSTGTGVYDLGTVINPSTPLELPRTGDSLSSNQITYIVSNIELSRNGAEIYIKKGDGATPPTVILHLNDSGVLNIRDNGRIRLDAGVRLKIYSHGSSLTLNSTSSTAAILSNTSTQIYGYTPSTIGISGNSTTPLRLFLFAPQSAVVFDGANVRGGVWAQSWQGTNSAVLVRELPSEQFSSTVQVPRMRPLTSWRRCRIPVAPEPLDSCPVQ